MERKLRKDTAVTRICLRKSEERIKGNGPIRESVEASGHTTDDLYRWISAELPNVEFPTAEGFDPCYCCWAWPCNLVLPEKKGAPWQVIVYGPKGCLYSLDFTLQEAGVEITGKPQKVVQKDSYILIADEIMEEASDEANGRSKETRATRKLPADRKYRIFDVTPEQADEKDFTIPCSFASELPGLQRCDPDGMGRSECERAAGIESGDVYIEILDHGEANADYSQLNNRGAVLDEHDNKDQIGVIVQGSAKLDKDNADGPVSRCILRMDDMEKGATRFRQMRKGIRTHLSAGYKHTKFLKKETLAGQTAYRFAAEYLEVSSVAVPMDPTVGVGRSLIGMVYRSAADLPRVDSLNKRRSEQTTPPKENSMTPEEIAAAEKAKIDAAVAKERADTEARVRAEMEVKIRTASTESEALVKKVSADVQTRCKEIGIAADAFIESRGDVAKEIRAIAQECLEKGLSDQDFKFRVHTGPLKTPAKVNTMAALGYDEKEIRQYNFRNAVQNIIVRAEDKENIREPDNSTLEGDVSIKLRKAMENGPCSKDSRFGRGFLIPHDANVTRPMRRDATMQATLFGQGGATVATEVHLPIIELLRNEMVTTKLGVTSMAGLEGNIVIPRQAAPATAYSVPEIGPLTLSGQVLDQISLTPKRAGTWAQYSKQFLLQSTIDVPNFILNDLFAVLALYWDEMILNGQGAGDQPTGILNTPGVLLVNGTGAFTGYSGDNNAVSWSDLVNFDTQINKVNGRRMGRGWATTSNARGRLETLAKLLVGATTVPSVALWEAMESDIDGYGMGKMKGYPAVDSQQVPNDLLMLGVWAMNVIHALWGGLDVVVDPYTGAGQGIVKIFMNTWGDVALRHPQEFCISLNAASN